MVVKSSFLVGFDGAVDNQQGEKREGEAAKTFNGPGPCYHTKSLHLVA